jgi:hypothetical protein
LTSILFMDFFDFLFFQPIGLHVGEAINHDLFGDGCAMPHGFGQLPVEVGSSAVGVSTTRTPAIDSSGFNRVEMHTPVTAFADVTNYPVNVDGVDVELLLGHRFRPLLLEGTLAKSSYLLPVVTASWPLDRDRNGGRPISAIAP